MYVKVQVQAGMRKEKVEQTGEHTFAMTVKEPASRNLANKRIRTILANWYTVPEGNVRIVTGHRSPGKIFDVTLET